MKRILSLFLCLAVLVSCFCFTTASAGSYLSTDKTEYGVGEPIMVTATGSGKDWVGIYPASDPTDGSKTSIYWYYVADYGSGNAVNIKTTVLNSDRGAWASIPVGEYKIVWYSNDSYNVYDTVNISVVEVDASETTYDIKVNGNEVADGEVLTVTNDGDITLQPAAIGGPAGQAWVGVYHAYYGKLTPYENAGGNMTDYKYVSEGSWNLSGVLWSGRSTVVLFGDGNYGKVLKVFYIQFNGFKEADFNLNGKEVANDSVVTLYKGYEQAVLNMTLGTGNSHGDPWYRVYNGISGSSDIDYSGYGAGDWVYVSNGDHNITSKLQEGRNTVVVYGNEKYNDIRKCIVIDYVTPDFSVDVDTLDSAAIRLDKKGLRFYTDVDEAEIEKLAGLGATVEAGTLIGPADLNPDALTLETNPNNI
ncbi:MAG: hypothetical protein IJD90_04425, partial [Clostridia bacterium]|nr:hypothetical protein [Clostridia bacterium]